MAASVPKCRTRALTIDIKHFSYGGINPLYNTFESELKQFEGANSSSSDEDTFKDDSDDINIEPTPYQFPDIFNTPKSSRNHYNGSKSMITNRNIPNRSIAITQSNTDNVYESGNNSPILRRSRPRSQTRTHNVSNKSFHHFRIRSITINQGVGDNIDNIEYDNNDNEDIDDDDGNNNNNNNDDDDDKENRLISARAMNAINEDEEDDIDNDINIKSPRHQHSGTTLIDGHPPLPIPPRNGYIDHDTTKYVIIPKNKQKVNNINAIDPKRKYIEKEIIETEETYYRGLNILLNELIIPMFDENLINDKYFNQCTSNLPALLSFHDKLLSQLVEAYEYGQNTNNNNKNIKFKSISQVFTSLNKEEFINLYLEYIRSYHCILDLFGNKFHKNHELQTFLKQKRREKKPLTNFLILPVQRVGRYVLLFTDLKKHTNPIHIDYVNIESALEFIQEITNEINERQRQIENMSQCLQIQEALSDLTESIVKPDREYQKQFVFIKKSNKRQRQFFCFNDIIIVTNQNWRVKHILDIRTVDIKIKQPNGTKKKKSFRFGIGSKKENDTNIIFKKDEKEQKKKESMKRFAEFTMLYLKQKPCSYISKTIGDIIEFERMIKNNRLILIDTDLAQQNNDTSELREALRENGVSQSDDYQQEITSMKSKRRRGNASADKYFLPQQLQ